MDSSRDVHFNWRAMADCLWRPAGVIYLCVCLLALAAGLWPEAIFPPSDNALHAAPLPTLHTLAAGQVLFFLLVYPLVVGKREREARHGGPSAGSGKNGGLQISDFGLKSEILISGSKRVSCRDTNSEFRDTFFATVTEIIGLFLVTIPFYFTAAWLGDATLRDVFRVVLAVAAVCPLSVLAGRWLPRRGCAAWALIGLAVIALGLPGAWYIGVEFLGRSGQALWSASPVLFVWSSASARKATMLPQPLWAWLAWPILAVAVTMIGVMADRRPRIAESG